MANVNEGLAKTRLQYEKAAEGIRSPTATILTPDEDLYRFTSSRIPGSGAPMPDSRVLTSRSSKNIFGPSYAITASAFAFKSQMSGMRSAPWSPNRCRSQSTA